MKKLLSLLLALMLLATPCALADADAPKTLTTPDGDCSFEVPADYVELNAETLQSLFSTEAMQDYAAQLLGLENAADLNRYVEILEASSMMFVYTADLKGNISVQVSEASLTMEMLVVLKNMLDASMYEQFRAIGVAEEDIRTMDIQTIGGRRWYAISATLMDMPQLMLITVENGMQYSFAFTNIGDEVCLQVLESITIAAQ